MRRLTAFVVSSLLCVACGDDESKTGGGGAGAGGSNGGAGGTGGQGGAGLVCEAPFVTKGPWSLAFTDTTARVRWEACSEEANPELVFAPEAGGEERTVAASVAPFTLTETYAAALGDFAPPDYAGTYYTHEAELDGLEPGKCYRYHLASDPERGGRVCAARAPGEPFTFLAIGDTNPALGSTPETLSRVLPSNPDFTIHGGDIQYYDSLVETWSYWFPVMQPMLSQGAFLPAIGNHESERSDELSSYALRFFGGAGFDGGETYYRFQSGGVWFFTVNTEEPISQGSPQAIWLQAGLEEAAADANHRFSVVYFHRPLVTCGDSGDDEAAFSHLAPIFEQNNVLFVIQAHMHGYERFEFDAGPTYVTAAGGGGLLGNVDENAARSYCNRREASGAFYHGVLFHVGETEVTGEAIDRDGAVRDTFSRAIP
ncbi:MAG: metallophosphoesterase family protein [Polyangiaceae bacterium]|nr:metallophosphoesterase family protein [Polyangiaceae bacterium]